MSALATLKAKIAGNEESPEDLVPSRLEQALANMVEKVIARQRLGQCKAQVRNQSTMEARDALRKLGLPQRNALDEEHFTAMIQALGYPPGFRSDKHVESVLECLKIMRCLDEFVLPDAILSEIIQQMEYEVLRVRDRVIMEGEEMDGVFKLCLAGIMQSDIDEYKNAIYLETGEYFCEEHLRAHLKVNPEPLVMMVTKQETHLVTVKPEHYLQFLAPYFQHSYAWKKEYLMTVDLFRGYTEAKLSGMSSVAGRCTFRAGEPIVLQGRTLMKRYLDTYDGIFFILKGEVAVFKQVEPKVGKRLTQGFGVGMGRTGSLALGDIGGDVRETDSEGSRSKRSHDDKKKEAADRRASILAKQKADKEKEQEKRRQSIIEATRQANTPTPEAPPPPVKPPSNKMGGKGQLYENMLMPLDDMKYGPEFKLATITLTAGQLTLLIKGDEDGDDLAGIKRVREGNKAVVMLPNPADYEKSVNVNVYVKGNPVEVDKALVAIREGCSISSVTEVNPYAPSSQLVPISAAHVDKVQSIILDVAQQTTTEIYFTTPKRQVLKIVGREGDCLRALEVIQSQLDKKMWTVQTRELRPGQSFGEAAYMEGDHPLHESYIQGPKEADKAEVSGVWKHQSVIALTHVECLVLTANDFGDMITRGTHEQVSDYYQNYPTDVSLQKTLLQYNKWDKYKRTLVEELHQYYQDPKNFGLPIHMPEIKDDTHGDGYLHMYLDRRGPEKRNKPKIKQVSVEAMHPPKIGVDHFSQK